MLPEQLNSLLDLYDKDDYSIYIENVTRDEDCCTILLKINGQRWHDDEFFSQKWLVQVSDVAEIRLSFEIADNMGFMDDHPLLWTYTDDYSELYFGAKAASPELVFSEIFDATISLFDSFRPDITSLFAIRSLLKRANSGLVAQAPSRLIDQYYDILLAHHLNPSIVSSKSHLQRKDKLGMLHIGEGYAIGSDFKFRQL